MIFDINTYPVQKLLMSQKDEEWRKANVNHIIGRRNSNYVDRHNRKDIMQIDYDLVDGIYNEKDLEMVTNPFKQDDGFPATPQNFNIIKPKIDLLIGEESKRPFNFTVIQTNDEAVTVMQNKKRDLLIEYFNKFMTGEGIELTPEEIEQYISKEYKSIPEKIANASLNYLKDKLNLPHEFLRGWRDALICGEEIYYVGIINGEPFVERINPLYCDFDKRPDLEFIEDGDWFLRHFRMSPASIYDRFFDLMDEEDLDRLVKMSNANYTTSSGGAAINWNPPISFNVNNIKEILLDVFHSVWKSYKKIGYLTYTDENGQVQQEIVDETYKKMPNEDVVWDWIVEIWEGYRIGSDLYVGMKPVEYQHQSIDNPNAKKLPYVGGFYGKSLVSTMKSLQYMYIILWYRLELALARDNGKAFVMDITQVPKSAGLDPAKWLHYLKALGVAFVNPYEEGWDVVGREGGKAAQFNQFQSVDLSMSNVIAGYIQLMEKIEGMIGEISGVSRQRQGSVSSSELVGNVERSVVQSSHITESLFWKHNQIKRNVLNNLINVAKHAWSVNGPKKIHYMMDDASRIFLEIEDDFLYSDLDVFATDSTKEHMRLESLKTLLQSAMQSGASLSEAAEIITSDNIQKIKEKLADIDERKQQAEQQQQQQQMEMSQQQIQAQQQMHAEDIALKREDMTLKSNTQIEVAMISAQAKLNSNTDNEIDDNGVPDVIDLQKLEMDRIKMIHTMDKDKSDVNMKMYKLQMEKDKQRQEFENKKKELEIKRIAANKKSSSSK